MSLFRLGVFQFAPVFGDAEGNLRRVEDALRAGAGADLIILPELFSTGYQFASREEVRALSEPVPDGATVKRLVKLAGEANAVIVAGLAERAGGVSYNSAVAVSKEGVLSHYRKIHLFADETIWFTPGDLPFSGFSVGEARVGMMVCFDWRFPEAARTLALRGADVIAHPSNLIRPHCPDAMVTRALENRVFAATANRTGSESRAGSETLSFIGKSQIVSPRGEVLFRMGEHEEGLRVAEIDISLARDKRVTPRNDLWASRRPEFYEK